MGGSIAFAVNSGKADTVAVREASMSEAARRGFHCILLQDQDEREGQSPPPIDKKDVVCLVTVGGDGTILRAVPFATLYEVPILGINMGRVGFLSEIGPKEFPVALENIIDGNFFCEERMMLRCDLNGTYVCSCLNEIILYRDSAGGTAHITISIDQWHAGSIFCDGIIASTPTGATGYSISAGGPVLSPGLDACIITPICPHSLSAKPIIAPPEARIAFQINSKGFLYADGNNYAELQPGDQIVVSKAEAKTKFIRFKEKNLFQLIRDKLL